MYEFLNLSVQISILLFNYSKSSLRISDLNLSHPEKEQLS